MSSLKTGKRWNLAENDGVYSENIYEAFPCIHTHTHTHTPFLEFGIARTPIMEV